SKVRPFLKSPATTIVKYLQRFIFLFPCGQNSSKQGCPHTVTSYYTPNPHFLQGGKENFFRFGVEFLSKKGTSSVESPQMRDISVIPSSRHIESKG
ncbi:MAG: hypothetical protein IKA76_04395, partial [Clostridia bacterium]|nr:hypothetical protein [Clostridia bacterium]